MDCVYDSYVECFGMRTCFYLLWCTPSCWSFLGQTGGSQVLSLQSPGCMWSGVAAHELMHALGFVHEQSRSDRDRYVSIVWRNIMTGLDEWWPFNIILLQWESLLFTYLFISLDLLSFRQTAFIISGNGWQTISIVHMTTTLSCIMEGELLFEAMQLLFFACFAARHRNTIYFICPSYRYAFSEDGGPTIIPRPDPYIPIGQRDGPSNLDLHKINVLYNCGRWTHTYSDRKKICLSFKMIDSIFSLLPTVGVN